MALFRRSSLWRSSFRVAAPYMAATEDFTNIGEISVQGTHHADVLKLWLSLRHFGLSGYAHLIEESMSVARRFLGRVKKRRFLELASEPETNLVCFRLLPGAGRDDEHADRLNIELQRRLLGEGKTFFSLPVYRNKRWLRAVLLNPFLDEALIDRIFASIDDFAARSGVDTFDELDSMNDSETS